jgi:hypothetical protein
MNDAAQLPLRHHFAQLQDGGVKAHIIVDSENRPARPGQLDDLRRFPRVHPQWLFTDAVFARLQRGGAHFLVQPVGRGHMHHVHLRPGNQLPVIAEGARNAQLRRHPLGQRWNVAQRRHAHAQPPERFDMHRADEPGANDPGAKLMDGFGGWRDLFHTIDIRFCQPALIATTAPPTAMAFFDPAAVPHSERADEVLDPLTPLRQTDF